jgi:tetratricopeptide (TPR) repeat protein
LLKTFLFSAFLIIPCILLAQKVPVSENISEKLEKISEEVREVSILSQEAQAKYLSPLVINADYSEPVENKMNKARFYFNNKDYISSGSLYYSIVMSIEEKNEVWEEALYYLAESLYLNRNFISASRYFEMLVTGKPDSKYRFDCLKRLIAASYRLGNYSEAKNYYSVFIDAGYDISRDPDLAYYLAKSMFFDDYTKEAFNVFSTLKPDNRYYLQSRYFLGVVELRQRNQEVAMGYFEKIIQADRNDKYHSYEKIRDLAVLAAARIAFEAGDLVKAVRYYLILDKRSVHFAEAYYELCWTYIKREEYTKAIDALRLIKFIDPGSIIVPQAEILEGSLLIRLERYGEAMMLFSSIVDRYGTIKDELFSLDSKNFSTNQTDERNVLAPFSPIVRSLLRDNKKYTNAISLYDDIAELEEEIARTEKLERRLASIFENENAAAVFPPLKEGSNQTIILQNRLAYSRNLILQMRREMIWENLPEAARKKYENLEAQRNKLAQSLEGVAISSGQLEEKTSEYARKIIKMEEELHRITIQVKSFNKQLDGINAFFMKNVPAGTDSRLSERIEREKEEISKIIGDLEKHKRDVENEKNRLVLGGDMISRVIITRSGLNKIMAEQQEILSSVKFANEYVTRIEQILGEIDNVERALDIFYSRLNKAVSEKIDRIRESYENEKNNLNEYKSELYAIKREVTEMASLAMYSNINRVRSTFSDIVLQADLGIIDVAWEKKDRTTGEILKLRLQRAQEVRSLFSDLENIE